MKILAGILLFILAGCSSNDADKSKTKGPLVYAKEPADSANYKHLKYDFYLSKTGQLCERKLTMGGERDNACNCEFKVYYDSIFSFYKSDTTIEKPLSTIVDINSFVWIDSTDYSKDKDKVFYFYSNSDGGSRVIVNKADALTFKRLCEYRWGIDKNHVFHNTDMLESINLKHLQVLYAPDTSDHFIQYVKDDKNVFFENNIVTGADAKTFKVVSGQKWEAEDKNYKYKTGKRQE